MLYIASHSHRHGTDITVFDSPIECDDMPDEVFIAEKLGIDFEPEIGETISIYPVGIEGISFDKNWNLID